MTDPHAPEPTPSPIADPAVADAAEVAAGPSIALPVTPTPDELLDHPIAFPAPWWVPVAWLVLIAGAIALRFSKLTDWSLTSDEARSAFHAWTLATGGPETLPIAAPTPLLLNALSVFLFGTTDATFRLVASIAGTAAIISLVATHRVAGKYGVLGMTALATISPVLVFASRVNTGTMLIGALVLGIAVTIVWTGSRPPARPTGAATVGVLLGLTIGCGASGVMALITLVVGLVLAALVVPKGAVRRGLGGIGADTRSLITSVGTLLLTLLVLYTRLFTDPGALRGIGETFANWVALLTAPAAISPSFYLVALCLYETVSVMLAIAGAVRGFGRPGNSASDDWLLLLGGWFAASFIAWSFVGGRSPDDTVLIALPLVLIAGCSLAGIVADTDWRDVRAGAGGLFALVVLGVSIALFAALVLFSYNARMDQTTYGPMLIVVGIVVPLLYVGWQAAKRERAEQRPGQLARIALLVYTAMLAGFGLSTASNLAFHRAVLGEEMLAQNFTTGAVKPTVEGLRRLARDVTLDDRSVRDTTGGHGLSVAIDPRVEWPWRWYLRDFPEAQVIKQNDAGAAQVVIGPKADALRERGYDVREVPVVTGVPDSYTSPDLGYLTRFLNPMDWITGARFLHLREGVYVPDTDPDALGFNAELSSRLSGGVAPGAALPDAGVIPATASADMTSPVGIAVAADGTGYAVDAVNGRVYHLDAFGDILDVWAGGAGPFDLSVPGNGLGPTGVAIGPDGLIYLADTWGHRVLVIDSAGDTVLELGGPLNDAGKRDATDNTDDPARSADNAGAFFGPRGVAVTEDAIYVTDTGNERVQAFDRDGNVRWTFGGFGNGDANLIEPVGIAVGADGNIYVADSGNQRITTLTPDGTLVGHFTVDAWPEPNPGGGKPFFQPYVAFLPDGRLAISSSPSGSVEIYWPDGTYDQFVTDLGGDLLGSPFGVAVGPQGDLWVSDPSIPAVAIGPIPPAVTTPASVEASPVGS